MYVTFSESTYTIRPPDLDDAWDGGDSGMHLTLEGLYLTRPDVSSWRTEYVDAKGAHLGCDDFQAGDEGHVVYAHYQTGSTFGSMETWCLISVRKNYSDAVANRETAEVANDYSWPWIGYFEHLISIDIESFEVRP